MPPSSSPAPPSPDVRAQLAVTQAKLRLLEHNQEKAKRAEEPGSDDSDDEETGKKRKSRGSTNYGQRGRGIPKIVSLFGDLEIIYDDALKYDVRELEGTADEDVEEFQNKSEADIVLIKQRQARSSRAMRIFQSQYPDIYEKFGTDAQSISTISAHLRTGGNSARGDDFSKLSPKVIEWLNDEFKLSLPQGNRDGRGLKHDKTGELLCSILFNWQDPEERQRLRNHSHEKGTFSNYLLRCLYRNFKGDRTQPGKGYLRSSLLLKVYKHIFTSPRSANDINSLLEAEDEAADENTPPPTKKTRRVARTSKGRKAVAKKLRMTSVTPRSLAYAAVMLVMCLTDTPQWCEEHDGLDFTRLYYSVVAFFEEAKPSKKTHREQLLKWWDKQIFPHSETVADQDAEAETLRLLNGD